ALAILFRRWHFERDVRIKSNRSLDQHPSEDPQDADQEYQAHYAERSNPLVKQGENDNPECEPEEPRWADRYADFVVGVVGEFAEPDLGAHTVPLVEILDAGQRGRELRRR